MPVATQVRSWRLLLPYRFLCVFVCLLTEAQLVSRVSARAHARIGLDQNLVFHPQRGRVAKSQSSCSPPRAPHAGGGVGVDFKIKGRSPTEAFSGEHNFHNLSKP